MTKTTPPAETAKSLAVKILIKAEIHPKKPYFHDGQLVEGFSLGIPITADWMGISKEDGERLIKASAALESSSESLTGLKEAVEALIFETRNMTVNYGEHKARIIREVLVAMLASHTAQLQSLLKAIEEREQASK